MLQSCNYFYGRKEVIKVTKINDIIVYDLNYGQQFFTTGTDTVFPVGSWEDSVSVWHYPK